MGPTPDELIRFLAKLKSTVSIEWRKNFTVAGPLAKDAGQVGKRIAAKAPLIHQRENLTYNPIWHSPIAPIDYRVR